MTTIIDWRQLEAKIDYNINTWEYETRSMALAHVLLDNLFGLSPEEIGDSITDGANDRGIDAVYIDEEKSIVHLFQFKHTPEYKKSNNNFPSNEVDKILSFAADLLSKQDSMQKNCNPVLWAKIQAIWEFIDQEIPQFEVHLCGNMKELVSTEFNRLVTGLKPYRNFQVRVYSIESIVSLILEKKHKVVNGEIRLIAKEYFERGDGDIRGLIAALPATELLRLITEHNDSDVVMPEVFDNNVRIYLGTKKNNINQKILKSALNQGSHFWYLNNGITITCSSFEYMPGTYSPIVKLTDYQIVNGGQTSNALFEAYKSDKERLGDVLVLVRIYETKKREISQLIAESTNSQTPINSRDLHSNDDIQRQLADEFASMGYYYESKTNQHKDKIKSRRVDSLAAGQAYLAYYLDYPEVAKKERGRVFGNLYELIFSSDITAKKLLTPFEVAKPIDEKKKEVQSLMRKGQPVDARLEIIVEANYHILYAVSLICQKKGLDITSSNLAIEQIDEAIDIINKIAKKRKAKVEKQGSTFRVLTFFKDSDTKNLIYHEILGAP
jgi:hypothetical protein